MIKHSIIIPTAGRPALLRNAISSVLSQDLIKYHAELIIVDNNFDNGISKEIEGYCKYLSSKLTYVRELSPGLTAARHRGANEAKGEMLTFLDDDVIVSDKWLSSIQKGFENDAVVMIGGPSIPKFTGTIPSWFWGFNKSTEYGGWMNSWLSLLDIGKDITNINPNYIWGLNFSIRKKVLMECGGFHPDLVPPDLQRWQGDGESGLTMKIKNLGLRADYLQDSLIFHVCGSDRLTISYFKKRAYYQGVCDSYTKIRSKTKANSLTRSFQKIKSIVSKTLRKNIVFVMDPIVTDNRDVKKITDKSYEEGFNFHQNQAKNDKSIVDWILRENYFNSDIRNFLNKTR